MFLDSWKPLKKVSNFDTIMMFRIFEKIHIYKDYDMALDNNIQFKY